VRRHQLLPLRQDDREIVVATSDPGDMDAESAVRFSAGRNVAFELAYPTAIRQAINERYSVDGGVEELLSRVDEDLVDVVRVVEELAPESVGAQEVHTAPVVKLTNLILREAVAQGASDIHIEPGAAGGLVRFRVDGVLRAFMQMPLPALSRVTSRIKILGKLDIADRMRPHDGRTRILVGGRNYDLRISTVPVRDSEKAVIRVLDPSRSIMLDDLGLATSELARFRHMLGHRDGIVIVTGPTGSGKTTTLYGALRELSTGERNISTVEDPVEYELPGIAQIQVEPKRGVTFPSALRALLRQDPDIILVGEIRDLETARVAVQASMTGHLVLATLHTNDALSVLPRLVDIGLDRSTLASTLRGALAQRLVRRLCPHCAVPATAPLTADEERLATHYRTRPVNRAVGCRKCADSGYKGRFAVMEVLTMSMRLQDQIIEGATPTELLRSATAAGLRPLQTVALERVASGETTVEEIERVIGETRAEEGADERSPQVHALVVDDDAENRLLARAVLERTGARVSEADDGVAALDHVAAAPDVSLILLDLDMPRLTGMEVLHRLKANVATVGIPVIVLTGSDNPDDEVAAMDAGADDYVRKPLDPMRFTARVKAALRRAAE
jgi:type II secretory ATPase GspE/PulE/Tfp pilus assembly ATPase PilB-like protein/CheY-like chemotaxis protein